MGPSLKVYRSPIKCGSMQLFKNGSLLAIMILVKAISRQLADTVERSKLTVGKLEGSSTVVDEVIS